MRLAQPPPALAMSAILPAPQWWRSERLRADRVPLLGVLFCLIVPLIPASAVFPGPLRGQGSLARLLAIAMVLVVLWRFATRRRVESLRSPNPGAVLMVCFLVLQLFTYFMGAFSVGNAEVEANKDRVAIATVAYAFVALYIITTVRYRRQQRYLIGALLTGLTWEMCVGALQSLAGADIRNLFVPPGFVNSVPETDIFSRGDAVRVVGTSQHPIEFVVLAAAMIPLALHMARYAGSPARRRWAMFAVAMACLALPLAVSRTGILAVLTAFIVYGVGQSVRFLLTTVVVGLVAAVTYRMVYPGPIASLISSVLTSGEDDSISARTDDYQWVADMFAARPWTGIGLGGNPYSWYPILDNQWLQAVIQGGVVGVVALALFVIAGVAGLATALRHSDSTRSRDQAYALGASFAAVTVSMVTFDLLVFQQVSAMLFVLYGLLWANSAQRGSDHSPSADENEELRAGR